MILGYLENAKHSFAVSPELKVIVSDHPGHWEERKVNNDFFRQYPGLVLHIKNEKCVERVEGIVRILKRLRELQRVARNVEQKKNKDHVRR